MDDGNGVGTTSVDVGEVGSGDSQRGPGDRNDSPQSPFAVGDRVLWAARVPKAGVITRMSTKGWDWVVRLDEYRYTDQVHVFESELTHE